MRFLLFLGLLTASLSEASSKISRAHFPEEMFRSEWDRGCSDWETILPSSENVAIRFERSDSRYWLWGQARVKAERGESLEALLESTRETLSKSSTYLGWVLPGINEHPRKNSSYFVELESLRIDNRSPSHVFLTGPFRFRLPALKLGGFSTIELKWEDNSVPHCAALLKSDPKLRVWRFRMFPRPDVLDWMIGEMIVVPAKNSKDAIIKIRMALKPSSLVYRLLPEKVIENELRFRALRVLANFVDFRRAAVWSSDAVSADENPAKTKGGSLETAPVSAPGKPAGAAKGKSR